jgi:hypothetical protein
MQKQLTNNQIKNLKIGDWKSSETPDGTILWTKPKRLFRKGSPLGVFATPHFDKDNVVSVDVVNLNKPYEDTTLTCKIYLKGDERDLQTYIKGMTEIFSMLV